MPYVTRARSLRTKVCVHCTRSFSYTPSRGSDRKYCTPGCRKDRQRADVRSAWASRPRCVVNDCTRPTRSASAEACETHYYRMRRTGSYDSRVLYRDDPRKCQQCSNPVPRQRKYCSAGCVAAGRAGRRRNPAQEPAVHSCEVCTNLIVSTNNHWRRYCSLLCKRFGQRIRKYGITLEEYAVLMSRQENACAICRRTDERLVVDHDHASGRVRGLLCGGCNIGIGSLGDDAVRLLSAADYVMRCPIPEGDRGVGVQ